MDDIHQALSPSGSRVWPIGSPDGYGREGEREEREVRVLISLAPSLQGHIGLAVLLDRSLLLVPLKTQLPPCPGSVTFLFTGEGSSAPPPILSTLPSPG